MPPFHHQKLSAAAAVLCAMAAPAFAQDSFCGGVGSNGIWIGGDEERSDVATTDNYREQMALVLGGNQYVSLFRVSETTDIRVEAAGRGSGDTVIDLFGPDGAIVLSDDDSGGDGASRAEVALSPGTYCMAMRSYDGGPMTAFVRVGRQEHEPLTMGMDEALRELSGSCADATPFGALGQSMVSSASETPFWSFAITDATALTITAENEDADPVLTLYDASENYIAENDDYDGLNSRIDLTDGLEPGTYCLGVDALNDDLAPITITVGTYDPEEALLSLYALGELAPPLDGSIPVTDLGALQSRLRQDVPGSVDTTWFSLDFEEAGLLVVEAIGSGGSDPWLVIYDDLGRQIGLNDDYGEGLDSLVMARVQSGTYIIGVRQYEAGQGFIRLLAERYIRAQ